MRQNFRALVFGFGLTLLLASNVSLGDPPEPDGDGGVVCDPPCHSFTCAGGFCYVCNEDGCVTIRNITEQEN